MSHEQVMELDESDVEFLAARVKRLCVHFGYPIPDQDDRFIVGVAASLIGGVLTKLELEKRKAPDLAQQAKDAARLDYLDRLAAKSISSNMHFGHCRSVVYERTGIGSNIFNSGSGQTAREAIDAAMKESGHD